MEEFEKRLRGYASGKQYYRGGTRSKAVLDRWSAHASENSKIAPRAKGDVAISMEKDRDIPTMPEGSETAWRKSPRAEGDKVIAEAKRDKNHTGGTHLTGVRREG